MGIENLIICDDEGVIEKKIVLDMAKDLGIIFPKSYVEFISQHNAAELENDHFSFFDKANNEYTEHGSIGAFYGFGYSCYDSKSIESAQDFDIYGYENVVAFAHSFGSDYICFDYRHNPMTDEPKIIYMDYESVDKETGKMVISHIADSFDEFCDMLYQWNDDEN